MRGLVGCHLDQDVAGLPDQLPARCLENPCYSGQIRFPLTQTRFRRGYKPASCSRSFLFDNREKVLRNTTRRLEKRDPIETVLRDGGA